MRVILLLLISLSILQHGTEATKIISLNNNWILENEEGGIKISNITIPSGIYTDLEKFNFTESILYSYNDIELRKYGNENWNYSMSFEMTEEYLEHDFIILNFDGLDTVTEIFLNDVLLGSTDNMFRRYRFDVKNILVKGQNRLKIHFESPIIAASLRNKSMERKILPACPPDTYKGECHINLLRKMQASFAWDWGLAAPSMGIWKDVKIESYDSINIRDITYELSSIVIQTDDNSDEGDDYKSKEPMYSNRHPKYMNDDEIGEFWILDFKIHVESGRGKSTLDGVLIYEIANVAGPFNQHFTVNTNIYGKAVLNINMKIPKTSVKLWWPNGYGEQKLYTFKAKWEDVRVNSVSYYTKIFLVAEKTINVGFRTVELVQELMGNGLSFYFRVNDIPVFMKGSNWIPAHILPEKTSDETKVKELLQAAKDSHMNMLRVWGGGVYESDYFYDLADKYGILIWQDMMFACAMYPAGKFLQNVRYEIRDQIKRIQHHPSIALYVTNNENEVALRSNWFGTNSNYEAFAQDYVELYVNTITAEIRKYDKSRKILTSSPSNGDWNKDRDDYGISIDPQSAHFGDIHYYPLFTNSWIPTTFHTARFASEYGFQSLPYGWDEVIRPGINDVLELMSHRQHHPLNSSLMIYLVQENLNVEFDKLDWQNRVYLSQLSQAIALKTETEVYRGGRSSFMNTMGALYWQLNDVWVAPSWSSIEYNGNFKIIQYWIEHLFAPISLITQVGVLNKLTIQAVSDEINVNSKDMTIKMNIYKFSDIEIIDTNEWKFEMLPNNVTAVDTIDLYKYLNEKGLDVHEHFMMFYLFDDNNPTSAVATNFIFPGGFEHLKSVRDPNLTHEFTSNKCDNGFHRISITIKIDTPAIFIFITLDHQDIKKYKLSKNGFIQTEPITAIQLSFENPDCKSVLKSESLNVKTLNKFLM